MRTSRKIIILVLFVVLVTGAYLLLFKGKNNSDTAGTQQTVAESGLTQNLPESTPTPEKVAVANASSAAPVSVAEISSESVMYLDLMGTVKANEQVKVFPSATGQIKDVLINEGDKVNTGDVLFTIGGTNGNKALVETQYQIALTNYSASQKGLESTIAGNNVSLKSAELQLVNAQHQAEGSYLDWQVFDQNMDASRYGVNVARDSLIATQNKNDLDYEKTQNGIDDLKSAIDALDGQRYSMDQTYQDLIDQAPDETTRTKLQQESAQKLAELDSKLETLYGQLETAQIGYKQLQSASALTENQILGQMQTAETTGKVLYLNQQSMGKKLGLDGESSDPVKLAQEGVNAIKVKNSATLTQANAQIDLARLNLDLARMQLDGLQVKAPISGLVGEVTVRSGDLVSPQVPMTTLSGTKNFELRTGVDIDSADKITVNSPAEVMIGGRYIKVPIKSISPMADPVTKLVNVTVSLPKIFFRANQTLKVRIPIKINNIQNGQSSLTIPLDAVIIGTEEQYVYVLENEKAKKTRVKLGPVNGDRVEILEGLNQNDQIIVDGAKQISDGQEVSVSNNLDSKKP